MIDSGCLNYHKYIMSLSSEISSVAHHNPHINAIFGLPFYAGTLRRQNTLLQVSLYEWQPTTAPANSISQLCCGEQTIWESVTSLESHIWPWTSLELGHALTANRGSIFFYLVDNANFSKKLVKLIFFTLVLDYNMELNDSQTNDGNILEERFEQLSRQNQQQNEMFEKLSETMDQRFTVMMEALKNLTRD